MGAIRLVFKDLLVPLNLLIRFVRWVPEFKHEVALFLTAATFVIFAFLTFSLAQINTIYSYHIHRGIWEDVAITLPNKRAFSDSEVKLLIARLGEGQRIGGTGERMSLFCQLEDILRARVNDRFSYFVVASTFPIALDIKGIGAGSQDISVLHGQFDAWIKSALFEDGGEFNPCEVGEGSVILTKSLAETLVPDLRKYDQGLKIHLGRWGSGWAEYSFVVKGLVTQDGGINAIYVNVNDLSKFGMIRGFNLIGFNLATKSPKKVKRALAEILGPGFTVRTSGENNVSCIMMLFVTLAIFSIILLGVVVCINAWFSSLHGIEKRRCGAYLLEIYNHGKIRTCLSFALLDASPAIFGVGMAVLILVLDWPISLSGFLIKALGGMGYAINRLEFIINPPFVYITMGTLALYFCLNLGIYLLKTRRVN